MYVRLNLSVYKFDTLLVFIYNVSHTALQCLTNILSAFGLTLCRSIQLISDLYHGYVSDLEVN